MKVKLEQNYKDYYTLANLDEAKAVIEFEKNEDESTVEEWATYAAREACKNAPLDLFADDIITADAYTARNSRVWNAYGDGTGDMDVWITGIAKGHKCFIEFGAYLSDIWQTGAIDYKHHMWIERYVKE